MTHEQLVDLIKSGNLKKLEKLPCNQTCDPKFLVIWSEGEEFVIDIYDSKGVISYPERRSTSMVSLYINYDHFMRRYTQILNRILTSADYDPLVILSDMVIKEIQSTQG